MEIHIYISPNEFEICQYLIIVLIAYVDTFIFTIVFCCMTDSTTNITISQSILLQWVLKLFSVALRIFSVSLHSFTFFTFLFSFF